MRRKCEERREDEQEEESEKHILYSGNVGGASENPFESLRDSEQGRDDNAESGSDGYE